MLFLRMSLRGRGGLVDFDKKCVFDGVLIFFSAFSCLFRI